MARPAMVTRRQFIAGSAAVFAAALGLGAYATQLEPFWISVERIPLPIERLPAALHGRRLVHISDLHAGGDVPDGYIERVFELVSGLAPEILVITGDLTDDGPTDTAKALYRTMPHGRLVTICVLGEHDYGADRPDPATGDGVADMLESAGAVVLRNESLAAAGLRVVGFDEVSVGRFQPREALSGVDVSGPSIALCHNPECVDIEGWGAYTGWVLAGHTHGGQVRVPLADLLFAPAGDSRGGYTGGAYDVGEGRSLYVNRGIGFDRQVRLLVRPEVTVFDLQTA